jgi:glutaredoxin
MTAVILIAMGIAALAMVIGSLMVIVAAFRQSVLWGLAYLFLPFAAFVFIIKYWAEAKAGFVTSMVGFIAVIGAIFAVPEIREGIVKGSTALPAMGAPMETKRDLTAEIQAQRDRIESLEGQFAQAGPVLAREYKDLEIRRKALKAGDEEMIGKFNKDAAAYQKQNAAMKAIPQEVAAAKQALDGLLAERAKSAATAPAGGQRIVMFSTANCGACKMAKQYFAQKGIAYEEFDVNQSRAANEEFQRLGGRGVPLILVGDKRVEGFSPQALDALLKGV